MSQIDLFCSRGWQPFSTFVSIPFGFAMSSMNSSEWSLHFKIYKHIILILQMHWRFVQKKKEAKPIMSIELNRVHPKRKVNISTEPPEHLFSECQYIAYVKSTHRHDVFPQGLVSSFSKFDNSIWTSYIKFHICLFPHKFTLFMKQTISVRVKNKTETLKSNTSGCSYYFRN